MYIYKKNQVIMDSLLIIIGCGLGSLLSIITKNYKKSNNKLRWPKYVELIDSLLGMILLILLVFHIKFYRELLTFFLSANIGFHFTNVF
jgi:hypothetical protein